jgi:MYXO-CTERM domain-containing protein
VVISQVYGAGGNSGASYTNDYVELFNRGTQTAAVGGWSVQYGSATGDFSQKVDIPAGVSLPPGGYYLVQLSGGTNGSALPAPDLTDSFNMAATAGKVALVRSTTLLACGSATNACNEPSIEDLVGYGASAAAYEGSAPASAPSTNANALFRQDNGCTDTDDNASDFRTAAADPRNSASPINDCSGVTPDSSTPTGDSIGPTEDLGQPDSTTPPPDTDDDGCACTTGHAPSSAGWDGPLGLGLVLLLLGLLRRRR